MTTGLLPIASPRQVRRSAVRLVRADRAAFVAVVATSCAAAAVGLLAPWLVGQIVNEVQAGSSVGVVDQLALLVVLAAIGQFVIGYLARYLGYRFGEQTSARLREQLTDRLMRLPARTVEKAGTGDLTAQATTDAGLVAFVLRDAAPEVLFALIQAGIILAAVFLLSPLLGVVGLAALFAIPVALRWYLRRARGAYLAESAAGAEVAEVLASTASGARTVEALRPPRSHSERALAATLQGRTVISVAHRLHTARDADLIAVMDAGRITELGTHHQLTATDGAYAALWQAWTGHTTDEP
ncbi:MAG: hypothetical protein L0H41_11145 [Microlunatus sp.]|nr:hypothetical protein [Microlunatus sp.]MDN5769727.1 hypothetical protein [Microlunatus sp.]